MVGLRRHDRADRHIIALSWVCALILGWAALAVCAYRFGTDDQAQYMIQVIAAESPDAFADDPYLDAFPALRSVFWTAVAAVSSEDSRSVVCLVIALLLATLAARLLIGIGVTLRGRPMLTVGDLALAATIPLLLIVPKEQNWFGLVALADLELTATVAALPLLFASLLLWLRGRDRLSLVAAMLIVPIHGQTAAYALSAWWLATMWTRRRDPRALMLPAVVGVAGLVGVIVEQAARSIDTAALERYETVGHRLFPQLIDPSLATMTAWGAVIAILALGVAACIADRRTITPPPPAADAMGRLRTWWLASLVFPTIGSGLILAGLRDPFLWALMPGRAFALSQFGALVLFGGWVMRRADAGPRGVRAATPCMVVVALWPGALGSMPVAAALLGLVIVIVAGTPRHATGHLPSGWRPGWHPVLPAALVVLVLAAHRFTTRDLSWTVPAEHPAWTATQRWARRHTDADAMFITPPYLSGWRLGSHRTTYGEMKDGGLLFYAGAPLLAWSDRMGVLGLDDSLAWHETRLVLDDEFLHPHARAAWRADYRDAIRSAIATLPANVPVYVVAECGHDVSCGECVWANDRFVVRRVRDAERVAITAEFDHANAMP